MTGLFVEKNVSRLYRQRGASVIKALVLIPVALILLLVLVFAFYEGRKAYWDYRVREMCEQDGGITVYERVPIPREYVHEDGSIHIPAKPAVAGRSLQFEAKSTDRFYYEWINEPIKTGRLAVGKHTFNVIRARDKKILGSMVVYSRSGGDMPTFAHPSSVSCPDAKTRPDPLERIFIKVDTTGRVGHE